MATDVSINRCDGVTIPRVTCFMTTSNDKTYLYKISRGKSETTLELEPFNMFDHVKYWISSKLSTLKLYFVWVKLSIMGILTAKKKTLE